MLDLRPGTRQAENRDQVSATRAEVFNVLHTPIWTALAARMFLTPASFGTGPVMVLGAGFVRTA